MLGGGCHVEEKLTVKTKNEMGMGIIEY